MESLICFSTAQDESHVFYMQQFATSTASGKCFDNFPCFQWKKVWFEEILFFFQNQKKFPIVWFQLLGGFPANIGYQSTNRMSAFGLLQLNALVAFDFLTCTLSSATAACAYVFKGTLILSTLGRRRKLSWSFFFWRGVDLFFSS